MRYVLRTTVSVQFGCGGAFAIYGVFLGLPEYVDDISGSALFFSSILKPIDIQMEFGNLICVLLFQLSLVLFIKFYYYHSSFD